MNPLSPPLAFCLLLFSGWINRQQQAVIDYLREENRGIEPAAERGTKTPWKTFLTAHWDGLAAADFFTVEVLTWRGLVRYVVFFVMTLKTRTVEIAGITSHPDEPWMTQMTRNLTDP